MNKTMPHNGTKKILYASVLIILVAGCIGVIYKLMFTGFSADEEYQLVLIYRLVQGDQPFREVWDTLQTSGFYGQFLLWIYILITGTTTGSLLFLRACGIITQFLVSVILFSTLKKHLSLENSVLISLSFFCTFTKLMTIPDFSNLQAWSIVLVTCFLWRSFDHFRFGHKPKGYLWLSLAALSFCITVLSSACVILIPILILCLFRLNKKSRLKRNLLFWGICLVAGLTFILILVRSIGLSDAVFGIKGMLTGDSTHTFLTLLNGQSKIRAYLRDSVILTVYLTVSFAIAFILSFLLRRTNIKLSILCVNIWIAESLIITLYDWFIRQTGYEGLKLYIPISILIGLYLSFFAFKKEHSLFDMTVPFYGILIGITVFINVLLISNMGLLMNLTFLNTACLWGLVILTSHMEKNGNQKTAELTLAIFCLVIMAGTALTLNNSPMGSTVFSLHKSGIMHEGPTKGTCVSSEMAQKYDNSFKYFAGLTQKSKKVLIITHFYKNQSLTTLYMTSNSEVCHYTVNSTPTYNDTLITYWEHYPEKKPDCIIINSDSCMEEDLRWAEQLIAGYDNLSLTVNDGVMYYLAP